jgi:hypothetical protein
VGLANSPNNSKFKLNCVSLGDALADEAAPVDGVVEGVVELAECVKPIEAVAGSGSGFVPLFDFSLDG